MPVAPPRSDAPATGRSRINLEEQVRFDHLPTIFLQGVRDGLRIVDGLDAMLHKQRDYVQLAPNT